MSLPGFEHYTIDDLPAQAKERLPQLRRILRTHKFPDWIKNANIAFELGLNRKLHGPMVRHMIAHLRVKEHAPICSTEAGYCLATRPEHLDMTIESMKGRLIKQRMSLEATEKARRKLQTPEKTGELFDVKNYTTYGDSSSHGRA